MANNDKQKLLVFEALLSLVSGVKEPPSEYELWVRTRDVADCCNISVYSARLHLLALETDGLVLCSHKSVGNSLRWFPVATHSMLKP